MNCIEMFYGLIILIVLQQVNLIVCQRIPNVPCPNIFEYAYDGYQWNGLVTLPTPETNTVVLVVNFTVGELGFDNYGKILLDDKDNAIKNIENYRPFKYTVVLPKTQNIPQVTSIIYNGDVMCTGSGLEPPYTTFWLSHTYKWSSSAITFPRKPNNSQQSYNPQQPNNYYPQEPNNYPQQPNYHPNNPNYYPQQPTNNYPQDTFNNFPQNPVIINYPQNQFNNNPQQPTNHFQPTNNFQPNNNFQPVSKPEPIDIPLPPVNQPTFQIPPPNNVIPAQPPNSNKKNKFKNIRSCGMVIRSKRNIKDSDVVPFIYNGTAIPRNNHPWLTALYDRDSGNSFFCGGNLISNKHVLTAAHCTISKKNIQVKVGAHNAHGMFDVGSVLRDVETISNHEEYVQGSAHADISLLVLKENVEFIATIKPICLWNAEADLHAVIGRTGTIMGWGLTESGDQSSTPLQTDITIASQQQCRSVDILKNSISDMTFCAGTRGAGPCMGDSGGGLFLQNRGKWYLRGIISVSVANRRLNMCDVNTYAVYVDTAKYIDWIVDNMK